MARIPGFLHVLPDGSAVWVNEDGVSEPRPPTMDLSDHVRSITLDGEECPPRGLLSGPITLRFYSLDDYEQDDDEAAGEPGATP